ncbi:MAG: hypothetical protein AB7T32_03545 [Dehalococcoidia bacterium]
MLSLHIGAGQGLLIETPSGDVEVWADEVKPESSEVALDFITPEEWENRPEAATYKLLDEFTLAVPDGQIRIKVLRFRPRPDGTGGSVSLGIDAPREWPVSK